MTITTKQRVFLAGLIVFTLWPIVHHGLVLKYEINPWKLAGWSMYCVRPAPIEVEVLTDAASLPEGWAMGLPPEVQQAVDQFEYDRRMWGLLEPPDAVAHAAFTAAPELRAVRIRVKDRRLDRETAHIVQKIDEYDYATAGEEEGTANSEQRTARAGE